MWKHLQQIYLRYFAFQGGRSYQKDIAGRLGRIECQDQFRTFKDGKGERCILRKGADNLCRDSRDRGFRYLVLIA